MKSNALIFLSLFLMLCGGANAQTVSVDDARAKAVAFLSNGANKVPARRGVKRKAVSVQNVELAYTAMKGDTTCFYVYNCGKDDGFVIIGGDKTAKDVLAYIPQGHFDYDNIPSSMKWWFSKYEKEIRVAIDESNSSTSRKTMAKASSNTTNVLEGQSDIPDMITTKWGQGEYYNTLTPLDYKNEHSATGCVPTAMAQIMKYWNYPVTGVGSHTDWYYPSSSADFGNTTYNWNNMLDSYGEGATQEQIDAVSTLMYHIGVAVDATFGSSTSVIDLAGNDYKTQIQLALENYFQYDNTTRCVCRSATTDEDWECIIYSELKAGRPVCYTGTNSSRTGHAFVCHGYSASLNMFSFNWGWNGSGDGYYSLSATDGVNGFTTDEAIYTGIQPKGHTSSEICYGDAFEYDGCHYYVQNPILKRAALTCDDTKNDNDSQYDYSGSVTIPSQVNYQNIDYKVTHIGRAAFSGYAHNNSKVNSISLPSTLLSLGTLAFRGCKKVESLTLPENIIKIGPMCFHVTGIKHLTIPNGVQELPSYCISSCEKLQDIKLSDNIKSIGFECFNGDIALQSIKIPNGLTYIDDIFGKDNGGCAELVKIELPESVDSIYSTCFSGCQSLNVMYCNAIEVPGVSSETFPGAIEVGVLYVPKASVDAYKSAKYWNRWGRIEAVEDAANDETIGEVFEYEGLKYQKIVGGVNLVGYTDDQIKNLNIPNHVPYNNENLTVIGISGYYPFDGIDLKLDSVSLPDSLLYINNKGFLNQTFTEIKLPQSVKYLGESAFGSCQKLKSISLPSQIDRLRSFVFSECRSLEKVIISENVKVIDTYAFQNCESLDSVVLPKNVCHIAEGSFVGCKKLKHMFSLSPAVYNLDDYISICKPDVWYFTYDEYFSDYQSDGTLYVLSDYINNYKGYDVWKYWGNIETIVPTTSITIKDNNIEIYRDESKSLSATAGPDDATLKDVAWSSSDPTIASVDQNGKITANKAGSATITATSIYFPDVSASCEVTVLPKKCTITYYVDDTICQVDSVEESSEISLPAAPTKEGYTFYRWEGVPEDGIMPGEDITIKAVYELTGDVNIDKKINITDAVDIVNDRLGYESNNFIRALSDINSDKQYTIADAIGVINIIYGETAGSSDVKSRVQSKEESLAFSQYDDKTLSIDMNSANSYSAFQFDVELPEGVELEGVSLNGSRCKGFASQFNRIDNNKYRVAAYNFNNEPLAAVNGNLLKFSVIGANESDEVVVSNIHFSTQKAVDVMFDDMSLTTATGIKPVITSNDDVEYNLAGLRVNKNYKGIVIVNGKKIIKK